MAIAWRASTRWLQVQQLLACGTAKATQAIVGFREIARLVRTAHQALQMHDPASEELVDSLLTVTTSPTGINRHISRVSFEKGCSALLEHIDALIVDPGEALERLDETCFWWREGTAQATAVPESTRASLDAFFTCALPHDCA